MAWIKRDELPQVVSVNYPEIWDGDGWQINRCADGRFILMDAVIPHWVPFSGICGHFDTLAEAQAWAEAEGRPDWSELSVLDNALREKDTAQ